MNVKWEMRSHKGDRSTNEDAIKCLENEGNYCFVLADGLGAYVKGEDASAFVCEYVVNTFKQMTVIGVEQVRQMVYDANTALISYQRDIGINNGIRTTIVICIITKDAFIFANVGDSRLYQFVEGEMSFQTKDHSVCQRLVDASKISANEARNHEDRSKLLSVLGQNEDLPMVNVGLLRRKSGVILLCSDGLWENVTELEMEVELAKAATVHKWLDLLEKRALLKANSPMDNFSEIAIFIEYK